MQGGSFFIGLAIIIAGLVIGGLYEVSPMPTDNGPRFAFRTNRFTGEMSVCTASGQGVTCRGELAAGTVPDLPEPDPAP